MKYETPEVVALTPAINAIQEPYVSKHLASDEDGKFTIVPSYADWE